MLQTVLLCIHEVFSRRLDDLTALQHTTQFNTVDGDSGFLCPDGAGKQIL